MSTKLSKNFSRNKNDLEKIKIFKSIILPEEEQDFKYFSKFFEMKNIKESNTQSLLDKEK
jgi:hypothetical protein